MIKDKKFNCCGCSTCVEICPTKCLKSDLNDNGFYEPKLCNDKCINCNLCEKVCPMLCKDENISESNNILCISGYSLDKKTRKSCSSGGVVYELCRKLIEEGYKVCSVRYNYDKDIAEHYIANNKEELNLSKGSKYIPSYCEKAINQLFDGNKYVIVGAPCQIAGIKKLVKIKKVEKRFIFMDFFCHGVPSQFIWWNYIKSLKTNSKIEKIDEVKFRDKKYGWHSFTVNIKAEDKELYSDKEIDKDMFYQFFLGNHALNECCYKCRYRLDKSEADIRVGDMWGKKYEKDKQGISGILVFTDKGKKLIDESKDFISITPENYDDIVEGQMHHSIEVPRYREKLIKEMRENNNIKVLYYKYIISKKIIRRIKSVYKEK